MLSTFHAVTPYPSPHSATINTLVHQKLGRIVFFYLYTVYKFLWEWQRHRACISVLQTGIKLYAKHDANWWMENLWLENPRLSFRLLTVQEK